MDIPVIDYKVMADRIKLIASHGWPKAKFESELRKIQGLHPDHPVWNRSMKSLCLEWACHNAAYALGIRREKTADCDLDYPQQWYVRLAYCAGGAVSWLFIS